MSKPYLIVGQGLAGSTLAFQLIQNNIDFKVIDDAAMPSSSRVAAGIYNPVTGKRFVKTWLAEDLYPLIEPFYAQMEAYCGNSYLQAMPVSRPLTSIKEQNQAIELCDRPEMEEFALFNPQNEHVGQLKEKHFGLMQSRQSGWLNLPALLTDFRAKLIAKNQMIEAKFNFNFLAINENQVSYKDTDYEAIIFCEGYFAKDNPFFNYLPYKYVKGDILEIEMEHGPQNQILSQGIFLVPIGNNRYKLGATYNWDDLTWEPNAEGAAELTQKLQKITNQNFKIIDAQAGIRPSTEDRRPYLGVHPRHKQLFIFNGFGTKAVSLCPLFSEQMMNFIVKNEHINPEANISRFSSLYLG